MSLMSGTISLGRRMTKARMTDACRITRDGEKTWDEERGRWVPAEVVVYDDICEVKAPTVSGKAADAGSQLVVVSQTEVRLPHEASGVMPGDLVTVTASQHRPDLIGREFTIHGPFDGSHTTALRYRVEVADERRRLQ